jgi:hypothetical protein
MLICDCPYTYVYKKYNEWNKLNVFKNIYKFILDEYLSKIIIKNVYIYY